MPADSRRSENERMLKEAQGHTDRFILFAFVNPYHSDCVEWFEEAVKHRGVRGLKLHPVLDAYPADRAYMLDPLLEVCDRYHLHCIIHCTSDAPNSSPLQMERTARRWPHVTFQMAHMGGCWLANDAIKVCQRNQNIYLDGFDGFLIGRQTGGRSLSGSVSNGHGCSVLSFRDGKTENETGCFGSGYL